MKRVELLAPAGTKEAFINVINAGANAVFMAGHRFGARAFAENFNESDLKESIEYAHLRGVLVYIVVNTLTYDDEVSDLFNYVDTLVKHHVDALIVQDIGMIQMLVNRYPDLRIHASTQVNAHDITQVEFLKSIGVKRVILARETSVETIKEIKANVDIELEAFIHGALCVSFSGNCLISSILNDRSGNRGECAYNCRLPYKLLKETEVISEESYLLSAKDLMTIEYIDTLIESGLDSFKIEGRMRKKEYAAQSVLSYRRAIDSYYTKKPVNLSSEIDKLRRVFNREHTKGYILNEIPKDLNNDFRPNHMGVKIGEVIGLKKNMALIKLSEGLENGDGFRIVGTHDYGNIVTYMERKNGTIVKEAFPKEEIYLEIKEAVSIGSVLYKTLDKELEKELYTYQNTGFKLIPLKGYVKAYTNDYLSFKIQDQDNNSIEVLSDTVLELAKNGPAKKEMIANQFKKLGGTPFYFESLEIFTDETSFISVSLMNEMRRKAIELLSEKRIYRDDLSKENTSLTSKFLWDDSESLIVKVHTKEQLLVAIELGIKTIYYDDLIESEINEVEGVSLIPSRKRIIEESPYPITKPTVIHELGSLFINNDHFPLITDEFINVTNIHTAALLSNHDVIRVTLSSELDKDHVLGFSDAYYKTYKNYPNLELIVYGHKDLMISKYCPVAKNFGYKPNCRLCFKNQYYLENDYQGKFALINDGHCNMRIMDPEAYNIIEDLEALKHARIRTFRLDFTLENKEETKVIIRAFQNKLASKPYKLPNEKFRKGHFDYKKSN